MADRKPRAVRGATWNHASTRFNLPQTQADGDWLDAREDIDGAPPPLATTVTVEHPRTIISRNGSPDVGFDRSINPYRGCEHGPRLLTTLAWAGRSPFALLRTPGLSCN